MVLQWTLQGPKNGPHNFLSYFRGLYDFYIVHHLLGPPMILEQFFYRCGTLPGLKGPSLTFLDPQMDPKTDPARLFSGDPLKKRAQWGPIMAKTDQFSYIGL